MGELVVNTYVSLDGVMQAPGEPDEDREGGFEHGGWQVPYLDSVTFGTGTVLLTYQRAGRPSYGDMAWDARQTG